MPESRYPKTLRVPDHLITRVRELRADNEQPPERGRTARKMERAAVVSLTGLLYDLPKETHIELLGDGNPNVGRLKAEGASPNARRTAEAIARRERDPMASFPIIGVHTHPGIDAPSEADLTNTANARGAFVPSRSLVVGPRRIYLLVPTRETWTLRTDLERRKADVSQVIGPVYNAAGSITSRPGENVGVFFNRGAHAAAIAGARAARLVVYEYSDETERFERLRP
jgi:hypothetical protein